VVTRLPAGLRSSVLTYEARFGPGRGALDEPECGLSKQICGSSWQGRDTRSESPTCGVGVPCVADRDEKRTVVQHENWPHTGRVSQTDATFRGYASDLPVSANIPCSITCFVFMGLWVRRKPWARFSVRFFASE
jgi:hypothetical protein